MTCERQTEGRSKSGTQGPRDVLAATGSVTVTTHELAEAKQRAERKKCVAQERAVCTRHSVRK